MFAKYSQSTAKTMSKKRVLAMGAQRRQSNHEMCKMLNLSLQQQAKKNAANQK